MKILFLTSDCDGLGVAKKFADEGHSVNVFIRQRNKAGTGIVELVDSWRPELPDADFVVCGSPEFGKYEDVFKKNGRPYIGASRFAGVILGERREKFLEECGVTICSNFEHTVMIHGFFNGRDWVKPLMISIMDTNLFPGKLGPNVGCMGVTLRLVKKWPEFVEKIGAGLRKLGIKDLISIPFNSDMEVLSVGCGFVYDVIEAISEGIREPLSDFLFRLANGIPDSFDMTTDCVVVVRLTIPPFPYPLNAEETIEILGLDEHNMRHVFLGDVFREGNKYFACTATGNTLKVAARGRDLREAQRRVYRTLGNISIPAKQYRIDVGDCVDEVLSNQVIKELVYV